MEVRGQLRVRPLYPQGKTLWYPLDRRLGGPQSRFGRGGEEKYFPAPPPPWIEPYNPDRPARRNSLDWLTHKIAIQLHLVAESFTICSSRASRRVRKLLDTPSYLVPEFMVTVDIRCQYHDFQDFIHYYYV
jgi:hypothetical protein